MRTTSHRRAWWWMLVVAALFVTPAAAQRSERAKAIGKRLMCLCGCNQILVECNHIGCSMSDQMLRELEGHVARNEPDDLTIQAFIQEYGQRVLAQPPTKGFSLLAWWLPVIASVIGLTLVLMAIQRWRQAPAPAAAGPVPRDVLERVRRETGAESEE